MTSPHPWAPGQNVASIRSGPITRAALALYAGASGDHNAVHIDSDAARAAGLPDVIGHGMFGMALLARAATTAARQHDLRTLATRFVAPIQIGDDLTCTASVVAVDETAQPATAQLALSAVNQHGQVRLAGEAIIVLENA